MPAKILKTSALVTTATGTAAAAKAGQRSEAARLFTQICGDDRAAALTSLTFQGAAT
jgi:predicted TIM-barrel enzyme